MANKIYMWNIFKNIFLGLFGVAVIAELLTLNLDKMSKKKTKLQEPINPPLLIASVSGSTTTSGIITNITTTNTTIWRGGYVTDNFRSYYLDENMVKHYR